MPRAADDFRAIRRRISDIRAAERRRWRTVRSDGTFRVSAAFAIGREHLTEQQQPAVPVEWGWDE